jgi:hypothetical protein
MYPTCHTLALAERRTKEPVKTCAVVPTPRLAGSLDPITGGIQGQPSNSRHRGCSEILPGQVTSFQSRCRSGAITQLPKKSRSQEADCSVAH